MSNKEVTDTKQIQGASNEKIFPKDKSSQTHLLMLVGTLALLGIVISFWSYHKVENELKEQTQDIHTQKQQNSNYISELKSLISTIKEHETRLQLLDNQFKGNLEAVRNLELKQTPSTSRIQLQLASSGIQIAQWVITYQHDVKTALQLMESVEAKLAKSQFPNSVEIRQAIASDVEALRGSQSIDVLNLLTRIQGLMEQITRLELNPVFVKEATEPTNPEIANDEEKNIKWWDKVKQELGSLVVIRRQNEPIKPLLSPENRVIVEQNLQLILQQAEWAAVHFQQDIYQFSLKQALQWLDQYFAKDAESNRAMREGIQELLNISVKLNLPTLQQSEQAIERALIALDTEAGTSYKTEAILKPNPTT